MRSAPAQVGAVLRGLCRDFASGILKPPPSVSYPLNASVAAFRRMQQAQHVGKLVVRVPDDADAAVRPDATYLVVGGAGGLGETVVQWLCERGAKSVVLIGRRTADARVQELISQAAARGANLAYFSADVSDEAQLRGVLDHCTAHLPPLRGVFHLAGVLDDGVIAGQTWSRMQAVFAPKIRGAWNLHRLTLELPLDHFVLFSSCVAWLGSTGQAAYGAANAWLKAPREERRQRGLPGASIAWGPWSEAGMSARLTDSQQQRWRDRGFHFIDPQHGLALFDRILETGAASSGAFRVDWDIYQQFNSASPLLGDVINRSTAPAAAIKSAPQNAAIASPIAHEPGQLRARLPEFVQEQVRAVLGVSAGEALEDRAQLPDLGLDSLLAVELLHRLRVGLSPPLVLSTTVLFEHPTMAELTDYLVASCDQC